MIKKLERRSGSCLRRLLTIFFVAGFVGSLFLARGAFAANAIFEVQDATITEKSDGVVAEVISFNNSSVVTSVRFYEPGDSATYKITIKNTDSKDHVISSISDNNNSATISYSYDAHENFEIAAGESFDFDVVAKYAELSSEPFVMLSTAFTIAFDGGEEAIGLNPGTNDGVMQHVVILAVFAVGLVICVIAGTKHYKQAIKLAAVAIAVSIIALSNLAQAASLSSNNVMLNAIYSFTDGIESAISISVEKENEWAASKKVELNCLSSCNGFRRQYSLDDGETWNDYTEPFVVEENNTRVIARMTDAEGNEIATEEKTVVKIDPVIPTVSITLAGSYYSGEALDLSTVTTYTAGESGATLHWYIDDVEITNLSDTYLINRLGEQYEIEVKAVAVSGAGLSAEDFSETLIIKYARWNDYLIGPLTRDNISNIKFVSWSEMPGDEADWTDISVNQDGAVMEYYVLDSETNLYDVYIASPYGYSRYKTDSMGSNLAYSTDANTSHTTSSSTGGAGSCQDGNYGLFAYMSNLKTIDFAYLDMFNINDMSCMFTNIDFTTTYWDANSNLTSINWGEKFNTENVTNMSFAFAGLTKLQSLDLSSFDMGSVESIEGIFARNETLETLELANWDTSKITAMNYAFYETPNLKNYNVEGWKTSSLISMRGMFYGSGIESLDLSGWDTSHVNSFYQLFEKTPNLHYVNMKGLNTSSVVDMAYMFERSGVYELDLSSFNTANVTNMDSMFYSANQLKTLDLQSFNTAQVTNMDYMFGNMTNLESINLDSFDTSSVTILRGAFYNDKKLKTVNFRHLDMSSMSDAMYMFYNTSSLENVFVEKTPTVKSGANLGYMWYASRINSYTVKEYGD